MKLPAAVMMTLFFSATHLLAADPTPIGSESFPEWLKAGGFLGAILGGPVFAIWYAWYMTAVRMPAIEKTHNDAMSEARKIHADHVNLLTANYREDVGHIWSQKHDDDKGLTEALNRIADRFECKFKEA